MSIGKPNYLLSDRKKISDTIDICIIKGVPANLLHVEQKSPLVGTLTSKILNKWRPATFINK